MRITSTILRCAHRRGALLVALAAMTAQGPARSQAVPAPPAAASAPTGNAPTQLAPVEVRSGTADDTALRRQSTAAKITIGRDEIERYGDSTLGDLLKRLPGVTLQGRPGRGGNIGMRGLGSGYTQILLDGERVPPGFSIDSLSPEQIERIEIQRAPTAETGTRAIAGTINFITREGFSKKLNDLRVSAAVENDALQPGVSWTRNDTLHGMAYNYSLSLFRNDRRSDSVTTTETRDVATDAVVLAQRDTGVVHELRQGLHATGRLQWRGDGGRNATLMPLVIYSGGEARRDARLEQSVGATPAPYELAHSDAQSSYALLRLHGNWSQRLGAGGHLEWRGGASQARFVSESVRVESTGGTLTRTLADDVENTDRNLSMTGKLTLLPGDGEHRVVSGAEIEANRRVEVRTTLQNGLPLLAEFGENLSAQADRIALYSQDEWSLSPNWAVHAGLRWEHIGTQGDAAPSEPTVRNTSRIWSPLLHLLWRPDPAGRDQVRASLTRSYRSPSLASLIARPSINARYPPPLDNTPTQPDRAGNPALKPELATGIDLAFEHYLPAGGLLSANLFQRRISDYMRGVTSLETVSWATTPRWVSRTQNVGNAVTRGIELEAKARLSALVGNAPPIDLRTNVSVFRSEVAQVPGPDNRIDQQPDWTANLGADYRLPGTPLTIGANLNLTPGYTTRISNEQTADVGDKVIADAYGLWVVSPTFQVRLTASNLDPRNYISGGSFEDAGVREASQTVSTTYLNLQLRLEFKL